MNKIETDELKELFEEWGLWSLIDDISPDGDGHGDNLQLTKEGLEAERMINQLLEEKEIEQSSDSLIRKEEWREKSKEEFYKQFGDISVIKNEISGNQYNGFWNWIEEKILQLLEENREGKIKVSPKHLRPQKGRICGKCGCNSHPSQLERIDLRKEIVRIFAEEEISLLLADSLQDKLVDFISKLLSERTFTDKELKFIRSKLDFNCIGEEAKIFNSIYDKIYKLLKVGDDLQE